MIALFFLSLLLPIQGTLVGFRLDPHRVFLLLLFAPLSIRLISGRAGRLTWSDLFMFCYTLWLTVTLVFHHGLERFPYAGILSIEMFGGYMAGRVFIRNVMDYQRFVRYFFVVLLFILPLALYESLYAKMLLADLLDNIFTVIVKNDEYRYGLSRVQVAFPHSILYGLFCSLALANIYYLYRDNKMRLLPRLAVVITTAFLSLSSAPIISIVLQVAMIAWDWLTKGSWKTLFALVITAYLTLELFTNRGAVIIFIETLTISPQSGWWRIHIWRYGSASVLNNPFLGIGLNDWVRPTWLTGSVDNFWLLTAMRHGLPAVTFILLAITTHAVAIFRTQNLNSETQAARRGYMITFIGLMFTLSTVHIWNEVSVFVMFYIGAGSFFYASGLGQESIFRGSENPGLLLRSAAPEAAELHSQNARRSLPPTRFPPIRK